jgi:hypothetical protein
MFVGRAAVAGYQFGTNLSESEQVCDGQNRYFKQFWVLEVVSILLEVAVADEGAAEVEERKVEVGVALPADAQSS